MPETESELVQIDAEEEPFVLIIGGSVGVGKLGDTSNPESLVDVVINEIVYVPWNAENTPPSKMRLVMPSEVAAEMGTILQDRAASIPTAAEQSLALTTEENK